MEGRPIPSFSSSRTSPERRERTYVIITADHGMGLGDRNNLSQHGNSLYDDQVRVPLVIFGPDVEPQQIDEPVSLQDLFPTILAMAEMEPLEHVCGTSLMPVLTGDESYEARPVIVEIFPDHANSRFRVALVEGRYKLIVDTRKNKLRQLFDLQEDPEERKDLYDAEAELTKTLEKRLRDLLKERGVYPQMYKNKKYRSYF